MKRSSASLIALALVALAATASATSNAQDVLKKLNDYQSAQTAQIADKRSTPEYRSLLQGIDANIKSMAADELKKVDIQTVSPDEAYMWEQVANKAQDNALVIAFAKKYLDSAPASEDAFKARMMEINSLNQTGDVKGLEDQIEAAKPMNGDQSSEFASSTMYEYSDTIDKKLGVNEAIKVLDSLKDKMIPIDAEAYYKQSYPMLRQHYPLGKAPFPTDDDLKKAIVKSISSRNDQMVPGLIAREAELLNSHDRNKEALKLIDDFTASNKLSDAAAKSLAKSRVQIALIGSPSPDFSAPGWDGKPASISALKGKVVILDFWATWCGPCMHSLPHLEKVYEAVKDKGVEVMALNVWDTKDAYDKWVPAHQAQYKFPFAFDPAGRGDASIASSKFGVSGIPTTIVIDQNGNVAASLVGFEENDMRLEKVLEKLGVKLGS